MKKFVSLVLVLAVSLFINACGANDSVSETSPITEAIVTTETTVPPVVRLSYADAADVFEEEFDKFNTLVDDVHYALSYYNDNDFTTIEDIQTYEAMWQSMSDDAKAIQTTLTEKRPPREYEDVWDDFADCMGQISDVFAKGTDFNTNHDNKYTGDEIADLLREIGDEFVELAYEACALADDLEAISETITFPSKSNDFSDNNNGHTCAECGESAPRSYTNPFSGKVEYYCETHYQEIIDMIGGMEEDVGSSNQSKHTCEECSREGTRRYESFTGQTEYYCTKHYEELMDMLEALGIE